MVNDKLAGMIHLCSVKRRARLSINPALRKRPLKATRLFCMPKFGSEYRRQRWLELAWKSPKFETKRSVRVFSNPSNPPGVHSMNPERASVRFGPTYDRRLAFSSIARRTDRAGCDRDYIQCNFAEFRTFWSGICLHSTRFSFRPG